MRKFLRKTAALLLLLTLFVSATQAFAATASISAEEAQEIALKAAGTGAVVKYKWKAHKERYTITILDGSTKHYIELSSSNGDILKQSEKTYKSGRLKQGSGNLIGEEKAKSIALGKAGKGTVIKCALDDGEYEVLIISGETKHEVKINATTGNVRKYKQKAITYDDAKRTRDMISSDDAKIIVQDLFGTGTMIKCKLDNDDGRITYEVEMVYSGFEYDVELDAKTGDILEYEVKIL